jgi:hypothetical protein
MRISLHPCLLISFALAVFLAGTHPLSAAARAETEKLVNATASYQFGMSRQPLAAVENLVRETQDPAQRNELERALARQLEGEATWECKQFVCRQLWFLGTAESVPALARLLGDEQTVNMACYALVRNPAPAAGKALRDAMTKAQGKTLISIIYALGHRRDAEAVVAINVLTWSQLPVAEVARSHPSGGQSRPSECR